MVKSPIVGAYCNGYIFQYLLWRMSHLRYPSHTHTHSDSDRSAEHRVDRGLTDHCTCKHAKDKAINTFMGL